jgi:crotonobetainyl-CoA:carnitine CoA-transferase CaiB-like acyl-CoA transferase
MTDAPHLSNETPGGDWADRMEQTVLDAALGLAPRLGWNSRMVRAACEACGLPFAPIARPDELFDDPHLAASGGLVPITLPDGKPTRLPALPPGAAARRVRRGFRPVHHSDSIS